MTPFLQFSVIKESKIVQELYGFILQKNAADEEI